MVGQGLPTLPPTTEPDVAGVRNCPTGEIAPRRCRVHDVERTVTHKCIICRMVLRGSWQAVGAEGAVQVAQPAQPAAKLQLARLRRLRPDNGSEYF